LALKLEQLGYEVVGTAESGEEAVALVVRNHPDLQE
jgi:YesN/AraC family two-component response regulator